MKIKQYLDKHCIHYEENVKLQTRTWIHRGGIARLMIYPSGYEQLEGVCRACYSWNLPFLVIGHTTNLYIKNSTNIDIVISTIHVNAIHISNQFFQVECGSTISKLSQMAINDGCHGYEGLVSLPGTIGGALVNNSGCFNCLASQQLVQADVLMPTGEISTWKPDDFLWSARSSSLKRKEKKGIILCAYFKRESTHDQQALLNESQKNSELRRLTQESPVQTLGSCFPMSTIMQFYHNLPFLLKCIYCYLPKSWSKFFILLWYRKLRLLPYISNRNFNCFIWKDNKADEVFDDYKQLIITISKHTEIEIEII